MGKIQRNKEIDIFASRKKLPVKGPIGPVVCWEL